MATRHAEPILVEERQAARKTTAQPPYLHSSSAAMRAIEQVMADIAPTEIPVLLIGESGTGKDAVALHLHRSSPRRGQTFRKYLGSSATPEQLSLNGASRDPGTVYLDEVADLPAAGQTRLLQSLAEHEGANAAPAPRLISGTTRNLEEGMRAGRFREELYFRLNGVCLRLPPLRHRKEDIPGLAEYFLARYAALFGRPQPALSPQEMRALEEYDWPGNIRELENAMKKAVVLGGEVFQIVEAAAVAEPAPEAAVTEPAPSLSLKDAARAASRRAERELILKALARTRWNRKRAAMELRISYKALLYKLKQIGPEEAAGD
ncbi:MAG TPA: sigma 54-interacting transcriptional regulator [Candidatus Acidoferrales bacterium]|nr:sigma 54-interacting transcriptional regulator [Candidatus Acidoferrales bacterium]